VHLLVVQLLVVQQFRRLASGPGAHALVDLDGAAAAGLRQRRGGGHRVNRRRGLYHIRIGHAQIAGGGGGVRLVGVLRQW